MPTPRKCPNCKNTRFWKTIYLFYYEEEDDSDGYIRKQRWVRKPIPVRLVCGRCKTTLMNKVKFLRGEKDA